MVSVPLTRVMPAKFAGRPMPQGSLGRLCFSDLMLRASRLRRLAGWILCGGAVAATTWVLLYVSDFAVDFLTIIVPASFAVYWWWKSAPNRLPLFPMLVVQQAFLFGLPIVRKAATLSDYSRAATSTSAWLFALFCGAMAVGWRVGSAGRAGKGSRYGFSALAGSRSTAKMFRLGIVILAGALVAKLSMYTFGHWIFSGAMQSLYPVYRSFESAAELGGSFVGALAVGIDRTERGKAFVFWSMIAALALVDTASLLLSAAMSVLFSAIIGSAAGRGRLPWLLLTTSFAIASFLHLGKMEMRTRYLDPRTNQDRRTIAKRTLGLPQFYLEWCEASLSNIFSVKSSIRRRTNEDHGLMSRFDNLQNLNAVVESLNHGTALFGGRSYTMIPMLMIPRFLWPDKPRTHEAQVQFNLHFGRQKSEKETLTTYIAVGLVAEAVGNFGFFLGPMAIGTVLGFAAGWLERVALWKQVVSLEGMLVFAVTSHMALAFEMSAAVLVTATLQIAVAVVGGYMLLELALGSTTDAPAHR